MTQKVNLEILAYNCFPFGFSRYVIDWYLHQDNDTKHTSYPRSDLLRRKLGKVLS